MSDEKVCRLNSLAKAVEAARVGKRHGRIWRAGTTGLVTIVAGLAASSSAGAATGCTDSDLVASARTSAKVTSSLVCLINEQRARRGLRAVKANRKLARAARGHSADMVRNDYFAHQSRNGATAVTRARRVGYLARGRAFWLAENIAWGSGRLSSPTAILQSWLNSTAHRANLLSPKAREVGLGIAEGSPSGGSDGAAFTLMLGKRA